MVKSGSALVFGATLNLWGLNVKMGRYIDLVRAKEIVREVGGERLVKRLEHGEDPVINLLSPISTAKRKELDQAVKTIKRARGYI